MLRGGDREGDGFSLARDTLCDDVKQAESPVAE